jgi:hypothetical protein
MSWVIDSVSSEPTFTHEREHLLRSLATVAVGVFHFDGQLGKSFAKARDEHDGVKPKAIRTNRRTCDFAHRSAHGNEWLGIVWVANGH